MAYNKDEVCGECCKKFSKKEGELGLVGCDFECQKWYHLRCTDLDENDFEVIRKKKSLKWFCKTCNKVSVMRNTTIQTLREQVNLLSKVNKEVEDRARDFGDLHQLIEKLEEGIARKFLKPIQASLEAGRSVSDMNRVCLLNKNKTEENHDNEEEEVTSIRLDGECMQQMRSGQKQPSPDVAKEWEFDTGDVNKIRKDQQVNITQNAERDANKQEGGTMELENRGESGKEQGRRSVSRPKSRNEQVFTTKGREETSSREGRQEQVDFERMFEERKLSPKTSFLNHEVLVIGDSIMRGAGEYMKGVGCEVKIFSGIRVEEVVNMVDLDKVIVPKVLVLHVGTNNIHDKSKIHVMQRIANLIDHCKEGKLNQTQIIVNGLVHRDDVNDNRIDSVNDSINWMCSKYDGVHYLDPNRRISKWEAARDGIHLNYRGGMWLGQLVEESIIEVINEERSMGGAQARGNC